MDRTQAPHHIDIGSGRRGFRDQNIANGQIGTRVDAPFLNSIQEEIMAVIENAGLQADGSDWTQLWQALNRLNMPGFRGRHNWHAVKSMSLASPPAQPEIGDAYLIPMGAQNDWAGHEGKIAVRDDDGWVYITPQDGHGIGLPDGQVYIRVNGGYQPLEQGLPGQGDNWRAVRSITTLAPPTNAAIGDAYLIPAGSVGEWQGKAGQIAIRDDDGWVYITPQDGHGIGLPDGSIYIRIAGQYELLQSGIPGQYNWRAVKSMTVKTPPSNAQTGDAYLIPQSSAGEWAGKSGQIAIRDDDKWVYITPQDGHGIGLPDGRIFIKHGGSYSEKIAEDVQSGKWLYAVAEGTENEITATLSPPPPALIPGLTVRLKISQNNTDAVTLNVNGLGAFEVKDQKGDPLGKDALMADSINDFIYDGSVWRAPSLVGSDPGWFGETGYQFLPGGLLIQWGWTLTQNAKTHYYPIAFPNQVLSLVASHWLLYSGENPIPRICVYTDPLPQYNKSQFRIYVEGAGTSGSGSKRVYYMAIGY